MMNAELVCTWLPQIREIRDQTLREKTVAAFLLAIERGGWTEETAPSAPVSASRPNCDVTLLEHIRDVTDVVMAAYDRLGKYYERHQAALDRDTLLCGALLHDLGKWVEYHPGAVQGEHSEVLLRHPISGAVLASEAGLPEEIVHIIATHSFEGDRAYRTPSSDFIRDLDMFVFRSSVYGM